MNFFRHVLMEEAGGGNAGGGSAGAGAAGALAGGNAGGTAGGSVPGVPASGNAGNSGGTPPPTDWTGSLNDDFKGFVQNKGWKDPSQVVDSYRNLEKLLGLPQDQVIKLPKEDDAAGWDAVMTRLGRPASPDGYKLEVPKEGGDPAMAKWASEQFHKAGLTEKQGKAMVESWNARNAETAATQKADYLAKCDQEAKALRKEWGAAHEQNLSIAQRACREFGVEAKVIDAMESAVGTAATMKFFHNLGSKIGESSFTIGNPVGGNGVMTPAQAKAEIARLGSDPGFVRKYGQGDADSVAKMNRLHIMANPDT